MEARQQRGLMIAAAAKIRRHGSGYAVPSQTSTGTYIVNVRQRRCTCPDFELRNLPCKHFYAVEFFLTRETRTNERGQTEITETRGVRLTYGQDWTAYNAAQTTEKDHFCRLLHDLCAGVREPAQGRGRPRLPLPDMLFAAGFKVYSTVSARRFMTDLRAACDAGYLRTVPHYNSIFNYLESDTLTPIIRDLIATSSQPLAAVESDFAVDSTGFGTSRFFRYYSMKYGREEVSRDWIKVHAMIGTKTNVVTSVEVTDRDSHDSPQFAPLVQATAERFAIREVSADKAYNSNASLELVDRLGGTAFIPFRARHRGDGPNPLWNKLFHFFSLNREEFLEHYHRRSNVEATFSAIKRVFGDSVRSRTPVAQTNEVLLKVLCHNIRVLIHETHELGITPTFLCPTSRANAQEIAGN